MYLLRDTKKPFAAKAKSFTIYGIMLFVILISAVDAEGTVYLLKPSTYMNLSGKAVRYWMDQERIPRENLLVISDDIALPFGTFRMRKNGSEGGHNGLRNITELLGDNQYARLRFGVGGDFARGRQVDYVLGEFTDEENKLMPERLKLFGDAVLSFVSIGPDRTMNTYNGK